MDAESVGLLGLGMIAGAFFVSDDASQWRLILFATGVLLLVVGVVVEAIANRS